MDCLLISKQCESFDGTEMTDEFNEVEFLREQNADLVAAMRESLASRLVALEDIGWTTLVGKGVDNDSGLDLSELNELAERLRDEAATNPLHVRGAQLRHAYVFGRGMYLTNLGDKVEALVKNPYNLQAMFSVQAYATNNLAMFTDGNLFVLRDSDNILTVVPMSQITDVALDPNDNAKIRYLKREWISGGKSKAMWYPLARFKNSRVGRGKRRSQTGGIQKSFTQSGKTIPVSQDTVIYHHTTKRQSGWTFGVPDSLAAVVWSVAYREYLSDNAALVKSLAQLAWKVTTATKAGGNNAAAEVKIPGTAGTAVLGQGNDIAAVSRGSDVNFGNGQPLAAMVAASLGVPVIALLSSPGATGGSYGAAQTLDEPTLKGMKALQDEWLLLYVEILTDMGAIEPEVAFPNISQDETYREVQSLATGYEAGALWQIEFRDAILDLLDVRKAKEGLPVPPEQKTLAAQGKTGAVPGGQDNNQTNHDND